MKTALLTTTALAALTSSASAAGKLTFSSDGSNPAVCTIAFDGSKLTTPCALETATTSTLTGRMGELEQRVSQLEGTLGQHHDRLVAVEPTPEPTGYPTATPSPAPTVHPTASPTFAPSLVTYAPTAAPTREGSFSSCKSAANNQHESNYAGCSSCWAHLGPPFQNAKDSPRGTLINAGANVCGGRASIHQDIARCHQQFDCTESPCTIPGDVCMSTESDSECSAAAPLCMQPVRALRDNPRLLIIIHLLVCCRSLRRPSKTG